MKFCEDLASNLSSKHYFFKSVSKYNQRIINLFFISCSLSKANYLKFNSKFKLLLINKKYVNFALNFVNPLMYFSHFFEDILSFETNSNNICFLNLNSKKPFVLKFKAFIFFWNLFLRARSTLALSLNTCFRGYSHFLTKVKLSLNFN